MLSSHGDRLRRQFAEETATIRVTAASLREKYCATLRELREKLTGVRLEDFFKFLVGVLSGIVIRSFAEKGLEALYDKLVATQLLVLVIAFVFLVVLYLGPRGRKREIREELRRVEGEANL